MEIRNEKIFFNEMQRFGFRGDFSIFTYKSSHDWCLCLVHLFAFASGVLTLLLFPRFFVFQIILNDMYVNNYRKTIIVIYFFLFFFRNTILKLMN